MTETDTLFQRWLELEDPDWNFERPIVVRSRITRNWHVQKPGLMYHSFDTFEAAILYANGR